MSMKSQYDMTVFVGSILVLCSATLSAAPLQPSARQYPQPPQNGDIYVIAHRGAHKGIPENTLAAYQKAIDLGADFVEIDLRTTKDGQFVSIHNHTVDAYTIDGTRGKVSDLTLAQIRAIDIGSRVGPHWKNQRIPTFDGILMLCKDKIGIYLDLKAAPIDSVVQHIKAHGMQQQVVWCIGPDQVAAVRRACPECIPMPDPESEATLPAMLKQTTPQIVAPVWRDFSNTFAAKCHQVGALVFVDEQQSTTANWQTAIDWGADGIQTDDPEKLIKFLNHQEDSGNVSRPNVANHDLAEAHQQFEKMLTGATLVGHFTMSDKPSNELSEERYTISKVTKVPGKEDVWRFAVQIKYGKYDVDMPLDLEVQWAGDTPMITLTDFTIPALGTFSARVLFHRGRYAGTWQHGKVGGHLFGKIEHKSTTDEQPTDD